MKCKYCGSNLNIDDKFCSFCGKENVHAVQHRKEMQHFRDDYNQTKGVVFEKSGRKVTLMAKGTIILVLIVLCFLILLAKDNNYKIRDWIDKIEITNNINAHKKNLARLEADRDFFGLSSYYEQNNLYLSQELEEYRNIVRISSYYFSIYQYTFELLNHGKYPYSSVEKLIEYICDQIVWCYNYSEYNEYSPEQYTKVHMDATEDLIYELETFIHVYLKVSREDIKTFPQLSSAKMQLIVERSVADVED